MSLRAINESFERKYNLQDIELTEARNYDNAEINSKIEQALSRKSFAKRYEKEFNDLGITVDYSSTQGTTLIGPNGRKLSSSRKELFGPSAPGHNYTHTKGHVNDYTWAENSVNRAKEKIDRIQSMLDNMSISDLNKYYPNMSVDEAVATLRADFEKAKDELEDRLEYLKKEKRETERNLNAQHKKRKQGHLIPYISDNTISKDDALYRDKVLYRQRTGKYMEPSEASIPVDYLNYLTKEPSALRTGRTPSPYTPNIEKYKDLQGNVDWAKDILDSNKRWYQILEPEDIQKEIDKLEAEFEEKIKQLISRNDRNKQSISNSYDKLNNAEKQKSDFLKSLGIGN